ncbi:hypothetical protein [Pseudomonas aeruginosa]|uniref:DUF7210 family protein n=1 Tax=Pseudomonas aeruginosa TaxID=287 RepID=UPI00149560F5|nr:hypothetical protein [Pseudomonas aeruginosa]
MSAKPTDTSPGKREVVTLIAGHTHAGQPKTKGDKIDVSETEKDFLIRHGKVAEPVNPSAAKAQE